jgi:hypothetical protein
MTSVNHMAVTFLFWVQFLNGLLAKNFSYNKEKIYFDLNGLGWYAFCRLDIFFWSYTEKSIILQSTVRLRQGLLTK